MTRTFAGAPTGPVRVLVATKPVDFRKGMDGLTRYLDDGRIEIDSNVVERAIRPLALGRKNHLFAGSDGGAQHWAVLASLIETCNLNDVDPQAYLADAVVRIVSGHPMSRLDELLPWAYRAAPQVA